MTLGLKEKFAHVIELAHVLSMDNEALITSHTVKIDGFYLVRYSGIITKSLVADFYARGIIEL